MKKVYFREHEIKMLKTGGYTYKSVEDAEKKAEEINKMIGNMCAAEIHSKMTDEFIGYGVFDMGMCEE